MNAGQALQAHVVAALSATGLYTFDAAPVRAALPHAVVEPPLLRDWSAVQTDGREGRVVVTLHDQGEQPERLWQLIEGVEAACMTLAAELAGGWRLIVGQVGTARVRRGEGLRWTAAVEMRVRMYRVQ